MCLVMPAERVTERRTLDHAQVQVVPHVVGSGGLALAAGGKTGRVHCQSHSRGAERYFTRIASGGPTRPALPGVSRVC